MRKPRSAMAGQMSSKSRPQTKTWVDDGILAVPIPPEERARAYAEIEEFIRRDKKKQQQPPKE